MFGYGGGYSEAEQDFLKAYKKSSRAPLKELMRMMGIKQVILLVKITDNPFIIYKVNKLMRQIHLKTRIIFFKRFLKLCVDETRNYFGKTEETIFFMENLSSNLECYRSDPKIIFDLRRLYLYLVNSQRNFIRNVLMPIVNTVENCFNTIGICGENKAAIEIYRYLLKNDAIKVIYYNQNEFYWDNNRKTYQLTGEECPEMVFHSTLFSENMMFRNKMIFCIDIDRCLMRNPSKSFNADIAWNVVPYLNANNVKTLIVSPPDIDCLKNKNELKKRMKRNKKWIRFGIIDYPSSLWLPEEKVSELKKASSKVDLTKGYMKLENQAGKYVNIVGGVRFTIGNPRGYDNKIIIFGPCIVRGVFVEDKNTIPSLLRKKVSKKYFVENRGSSYWNLNLTIRKERFRPNDIVIIFINNKELFIDRQIDVLDLTYCYQKIPKLKDHICDSLYHCDAFVNYYIANELIEYMNKKDYFNTIIPENIEEEELKREICFGKSKKRNHLIAFGELEKYNVNSEGSRGAIVMNGNPFTNGHLYLIETAAKKVDMLYVFVVQEDRSVFPFRERFRLVKEGTKHLSNVKVLPSGQYMISASTMPGYFKKEELQNTKLDASMDLEIFSRHIAPALNITVRFVGEEPLDHFTRQYNESMKELFPQYGIELVEIKRKETDGKVISASRVRSLLKEEKWEGIRRLVPDCTYQYLSRQAADANK